MQGGDVNLCAVTCLFLSYLGVPLDSGLLCIFLFVSMYVNHPSLPDFNV